MLVLMNGSMPTVKLYRDTVPFGLLLTPLGGLGVITAFATDFPIAVDNGAFAGLDVAKFRRLLGRIPEPARCLWVACPDVVGDAEATIAMFETWEPEIRGMGFRVAFVGQDGLDRVCRCQREAIWDRCDAFFVGGTDAFKVPSPIAPVPPAVPLIREAQAHGKWVHFGRVNGVGRIRYCDRLGVDSIDGSGLVRSSRDKIPRVSRYFVERKKKPLFRYFD